MYNKANIKTTIFKLLDTALINEILLETNGGHCFICTGVPSVVTTTCSEGDGKVTLTWKQPDKNGAAITLYKVYQKKGSEKNWMEIATIEKNSTHEYVVRNLEKDEVYVFLVTATNEYGESVKEGNCKGVKVPEGKYNVTLSIIVVCERALYKKLA